MAENQNYGVKPRDCHEGTCSAAPVVQNEFCLSSAIANQTPRQVEQGQSAPLSGENSVSGAEVKADHEGEGSAASMPNPEKWSHEAIVAFVKCATGADVETQSGGKFGAESEV